MVDKEFNLLYEGWIKVRKKDCTVDTLSLIDAILKSHEYVDLAGELPTQDVAMLRLMLAVVHTVFSRYDLEGSERMLQKPQDALTRWSKLWSAGKFPEKPIRTYLETWHERFWLFHPERPFYQTPAVYDEKTAADFKSPKLNSAIGESNNKTRLFAERADDEKKYLEYGEAARWLVNLNSFDDQANERGKKGIDTVGVGWLGNLGIIYANGKSLFERLMLNLILFNFEKNKLWKLEKPIWEVEELYDKPRREIVQPNTMSELYTLQSRRIILTQEDKRVVGYKVCGGDYFSSVDAFIEPMTLWRKNNEKSNKKIPQYNPKRHDSANQMWREFSSCFYNCQQDRRPKIVDWISYLREKIAINRETYVSFMICSIEYGQMNSYCDNLFSDSLTFHTDLLTELGTNWQTYITIEVAKCDELAKAMRQLAKNLELAKGVSPDDAIKCSAVQSAGEQLYYEIDVPFRQWLASIDPSWAEDSEEKDNAIRTWRNTAKGIALRLGKKLVDASGPAAIVGRMGKDEKGNDKYYCAADAYRRFQYRLGVIYPKEEHDD